jgi:L-fuconolactonase
MKLSRRTLLQASAGALATTACAHLAHAAHEAPPIIDTHQHLWDLEQFTLPWLGNEGPLARSFVTKDYLAAIDGLNIVQAVYMEVDVTPAQHVKEAEYVLQLTTNPRNLTAAAVIGGRPGEEGFAAYVARFKDEPKVTGVRQVLHGAGTPAGYCLGKEFVAGVRKLGELGKTFDLCMRPAELGDAEKLVRACPDTRFVLDHCGNGSIAMFQRATRDEKAIDRYRRDIDALAAHERVMCKISGIVAQLAGKEWSAADLAPVINTCLDAFGPERVLFASDWPVCTLGMSLVEWVEALREIVAERPAADQRRLFHDNARKFYGLAAR